MQRLSALINLGRTAEYTRAIEQAFDGGPRPRRARTCTGTCTRSPRWPRTTRARWTAASPTSCGRARALGVVEDPDRDTAWGWHDLAMAYSLPQLPRLRPGRHRAGPAGRGSTAGIPEETFAAPGIRLRNAVALDHNGDSDGCLRVLRDVAADLARFVRGRRGRPAAPEQPGGVRVRAGPQAALGAPVEPTGRAASRPG